MIFSNVPILFPHLYLKKTLKHPVPLYFSLNSSSSIFSCCIMVRRSKIDAPKGRKHILTAHKLLFLYTLFALEREVVKASLDV